MKSSKKDILTFIILILILITFNNCNLSNAPIKNAKDQKYKPNVIFIMTDDQGYGDVAHHGNSIIKTPILDAFAKEAIELTNFHVGTTCTPTRAGLMTGRNANRNGAWHTIAGCSILNKDEETIAEIFQKNDYKTGHFGKWHLGDNYPFRPHDRGFDEALYCNGGGVWQSPDYWLNDYFDDTYYRNGIPEKTKGYCTDVWFKEAISFIDQNKGEPFFVYLAPNAAHYPFNVPKDFLDIYQNADLDQPLKRFYGMISNLDHNFGKLQQYLSNNNLIDNTIIIYTTDNGTAGGIRTNKITGESYGFNAGLRGQKASHYDGGHRVPFYIKYPDANIQGGLKSSELVAHVDILPTLTSLCHIEHDSKKQLDGKNCLGLIKGEETDSSRMLVVDTQRNQWPEKGRRPCVMSRDWRLVNGTELYHTKKDPGQQFDVSKNHPNLVLEMQNFYNSWWSQIESEMKYSAIPIGDQQANPTQICVHDLHTENPIPWNQVQIRKAENNPLDGFYNIDIVETGDYLFTLSRYPLESKLKLDESANLVKDQENIDGFPQAKSLMITEGIIEINKEAFSNIADDEATYISIESNLAAGKAKLKSWFVLNDGSKIPAYYTKVEKVF